MPTSTPSPATTPQSHTDAIEAGSSDGHDSANASPRSQQSRLSSSSASSSSEDAHHHDRRQSQYHDIGYLNTLAQSGAGEGGQFRIVRGSEARHILGQYQKCVFLLLGACCECSSGRPVMRCSDTSPARWSLPAQR